VTNSIEHARDNATMSIRYPILVLLLTAACIMTAGCVRRTLRISSTPPGALVWVNHREIGRTPLEVDFTYYGHYDVQLSLEGSEPLLTTGQANPPVWDMIGMDLLFEVAPFESQSVVEWHFDLEPRDGDLNALVTRAQALRLEAEPDRPMSTVRLGKDGRPKGTQAPKEDSKDSAK
jgi:hypothetical protein